MELKDHFEDAQKRVKKLKKAPGPGELLQLYSLFKQGTIGDVTGDRPGMIDFKGRAKWDAWKDKKGMAKDKAMQDYVDLVVVLEKKYN